MNTQNLNFTEIGGTNITGAYHDGEDLYLRFKRNGSVYCYREVPHRVFEELVAAESAGKYFHANIAHNYEYLDTTKPVKADLEAAQE